MFKKLAHWFTPQRRQLIQAALASLAILVVSFGYGTQTQADQALILTGATMQLVASLLSLVNVRIADWATMGWAIVRASLYAFVSIASPALVVLGLYGEDVNTRLVTGVSLALSAVSSFVAIFASGEQQKVVVADLATVAALSEPAAERVVSVRAAAARLGLSPADVSRVLYRTADDSPWT